MSANPLVQATRVRESFQQWREDVGLGLHILSSSAAWASHHYRTIIAATTILIILSTVSLRENWLSLTATLIIYCAHLYIIKLYGNQNLNGLNTITSNLHESNLA